MFLFYDSEINFQELFRLISTLTTILKLFATKEPLAYDCLS